MKLDWLNRYNLLSFEEIDSTNSEALRLASSGALGDFVITSSIQTGGRGTRGKNWYSFEGNFHATLLLQIHHDPKLNTQLPFIAANALYEAIEYIAKSHNINLDIKLKWPNDVLINGSKVAGILLESIEIKGKLYVAIGFGVNIVKAPSISAKTVSLKNLGVKIDNIEFFLNILVGKFEKMYQEWQLGNSFTHVKQKWLKRAYLLNKNITIQDGKTQISGIFKGLENNGEMRILLENGKYHNIFSGSIIL